MAPLAWETGKSHKVQDPVNRLDVATPRLCDVEDILV